MEIPKILQIPLKVITTTLRLPLSLSVTLGKIEGHLQTWLSLPPTQPLQNNKLHKRRDIRKRASILFASEQYPKTKQM